jgi:hypothetical protein
MPPIARSYVRAAFVYFVAAFVLGAVMMIDRWVNIGRWLKVVSVSQLHLLMVGWITQLAVGVAYWMFPRNLKESGLAPRGPDALAWIVLITLNVGLLLRFAVEPFYLMGPQAWLVPQTWLGALLALSGVLQAIAAICFAWLVWTRIRSME